jgi:uncharacterized protein YozE (UPF0346 family)
MAIQENKSLASFIVLGGLLIVGFILQGIALANVIENNKPLPVDLSNVATKDDVSALSTKVDNIEVVVPDNEKINDLWEDLHKDKITLLKDTAYDDALAELEDDDYEKLVDYLKTTIEDFDELKDVDVVKYEVNVVNLGLKEDEDKVAEVTFKLKVYYTLKDGVDELFKKTVYAKAVVTYEEGDFDDVDVAFTFT